jgi:hypothetical protein
MVQQVELTPYELTAHELAAAHRLADPQTVVVMLDPDPAEQEIRLVEVSTTAPTTRELYPFAFDARRDQGINFPSVVLLLSPIEWKEVNAGQLPLPAGWDRTRLRAL